MAIPLTQEFDGQLSLFGTESNSIIVSNPYDILIDNVSRGVKRLQLEITRIRTIEKDLSNKFDIEKELLALKIKYDSFIDCLIDLYQGIPLEEILNHNEDDATLWHNLSKVLLFYLKNYIYKEGLVKTLNDTRARVLENIISLDQINFRDDYYKNILEEMNRRNKARVENYIIYDGDSLLKEVKELIKTRGELSASYVIAPKIKELLERKNILEDLFVSKVELDDKNQRGTLAMLFLHFLRECVYDDPRNGNINKFIENIEFFVIVNYSPDFQLSKRQQRAYDIAIKNVSNKMIKYVDKNSESIFKAIRDYDLIETRKRENKILMFEQNENLDDLPVPHTSEEIRTMLETFLYSVFLLKYNLPKENQPIFCDDALIARMDSMKLALIYLGRFAYKNRNSENDPFICLLEDYIYDDKHFALSSDDMGEMFTTKSTLMARVAKRRVKLECPKPNTLKLASNISN